MESPFNLMDYEISHDDLPNILWRVTHSKSQSRPHPATGDHLASSMANDAITDEASLKLRAANHFSWKSQESSCFLSAFTDEKHATNWARKRHHDSPAGNGDVYITRIITTMLPTDAHVFDATRLCSTLGIQHEYSEHELIFFGRIQWQSLGHTRHLSTDIPKQTSPFPTVGSLQGLNDDFATFMDRVVAANHLILLDQGITAGGLAGPARIMGKAYQETIRSLVSTVIDKHYETNNPDQVANWDRSDSFSALTRLLTDTLNEKKRRHVGFAEEDGPGAPATLTKVPQKKVVSPRIGNIFARSSASLSATEGYEIPNISLLVLADD